MTNIDTSTQSSRRRETSSARKLSALQLLVDIIRKRPTASEESHKAAFRALIQQEGYEEYLDAVINDWLAIKFNSAVGIAIPPTPAQQQEKRNARAVRTAEVERAAADLKVRAPQLILLDLVMPNGKALRDCTGKDCAKAGGWLSKIAGSIKPTDIVGRVLSEAQVRKFWPK